MKKIFLFVAAIAISIAALAQAPNAFKYQAVARDAAGNVIANNNVNFKISILKSSVSGSAVYSETFSSTTNEFGLVNLVIGKGIVVSGNISTINWGTDSYFIKIEMDAAGGSNYQLMGVSQLLSVPYALYAEKTKDNYIFIMTKPSDITLPQGSFNTIYTSLTYINGPQEAVTFSSSGAPAGITISSSSGTPNFSSTVTVSASAIAPVGTYPITLTGTSTSGVTRSQSFNLNITGCPNYFYGTYSHYDTIKVNNINTLTGPFSSIIAKTANDSVSITNFGGANITIKAKVNCSNQNSVYFTISTQTIGGCTYSGSGNCSNGGKPYFTYTKTCNGTPYYCGWKY